MNQQHQQEQQEQQQQPSVAAQAKPLDIAVVAAQSAADSPPKKIDSIHYENGSSSPQDEVYEKSAVVTKREMLWLAAMMFMTFCAAFNLWGPSDHCMFVTVCSVIVLVLEPIAIAIKLREIYQRYKVQRDDQDALAYQEACV